MGREMVQDLRQDVDIGSDLYKTLEESKLCDTVGYVAIPECAAKNEGDECAAKKTEELIKKPLRHAIKAEKIKEMPSGQKFFAYCKHIGYKNVLATFKRSRSLMSAECGLPGQKLGNRHARNTELLPALLLAGSYDPSSIWFQYFLCKDIDLYCYFFTQGWTQGQYGQYYLYDNLLDDNTGLFAGSTDSSNLATIALLGGLGGGIGQSSGYYPSYGAHAATPAQGRKRRAAEEEEEERDRRSVDCKKTPDVDECNDRQRRSVDCKKNPDECKDRQRRSVDCKENPDECKDRQRRSVDCKKNPDADECKGRKRRSNDCKNSDAVECKDIKRRSVDCKKSPDECRDRQRRLVDCKKNPDADECKGRKRRSIDCNKNPDECKERKRRSVDCEETPNVQECLNKQRRSVSSACEACENNPDSTECNDCLGPK